MIICCSAKQNLQSKFSICNPLFKFVGHYRTSGVLNEALLKTDDNVCNFVDTKGKDVGLQNLE